MIELLPAVPKYLPNGRIEGALCRGQVEVRRLAWTPGQADVVLRSKVDQTITLRLHRGIKSIRVDGGAAQTQSPGSHRTDAKVALPAGRDIHLVIQRD